MSDIITAILAINPDAAGKVSVSGEDYKKITYGKGVTPIAKSVIKAKQVELKAEYDAKKYQRDRAIAYPSIQDQLDMQYKDLLNDTTTWKDAVAKVKTDNPKD